MTIKDLRAAIQSGIERLTANRDADALRIAGDQLALLKLRIQTSGNNANGIRFDDYTKPYAKQRVKAGFQANFVDFTRTGRMWANIQPKIVASSLIGCTVEVKASIPSEQVKLQGQSRKRGNILESSQEEIELVRKANSARIKSYFKF